MFKVGDKVLRLNKQRNSKLDSKYEGPYEVIQVNNEVNVTITDGRQTWRVHVNLLRLIDMNE